MKLHEIGLLAKDPEASKRFYHDTLGLDLHHEEDGLSVFDGGWPGIEMWRMHYNQVRPHSSLGYRPPAPEAAPGPSIRPVS